MCLEQTNQKLKRCWMPSRLGQILLTMTRKPVEELLEKAISRDWIKTQHCHHLLKEYLSFTFNHLYTYSICYPATIFYQPLHIHLYHTHFPSAFFLHACTSYMFLIHHLSLSFCNTSHAVFVCLLSL